MSKDFNKVIMTGRLAKDPEIKTTPNGKKVCRFALAVGQEWKDKSGNKTESVAFNPCVAWGTAAEIMELYLHKGDRILVEGQMLTRSYKNKDGSMRWQTECQLERLLMLGQSKGGDRNAPAAKRQVQEQDYREEISYGDFTPETIPF